MLWVFFFSYFIKNKRIPSKTSHTYFLMLEENIGNSKFIDISSSIKLVIKSAIPNSSFSFNAIVIIAYKEFENNPCPWDWLNIQAFTLKE
jgi:hypothetical protein